MYCRCVDPVDIVVSQDAAKANILVPSRKHSMVGYIIMKDAASAIYVSQASSLVRFQLSVDIEIMAEVIPIFLKRKTNVFSNSSAEHVLIAINDRHAELFQMYVHSLGLFGGDVQISNAKVHFLIKHRYFEDLLNAVEHIPQAIINKLVSSPRSERHQRDNIFYDHTHNFELHPFVPDKLQLEAITSMLSTSSEAPFLLLGPFGTGKTHVLACATAAIVSGDMYAKVLIVTHHNKSADTFVYKYFGTLESTKCLPSMVAPVRIVSEESSQDEDKQYFLHVNDPMITKELLDERRIVITTFLTALRFVFTAKLPRGYFTHILIDEGAQSREPETIAPLIFADVTTKIIIAGDHLQVCIPSTLSLYSVTT